MEKYSTIFLFPGAVGYLLATALRRTGRKVLTISPSVSNKQPAPGLLGSAVYFPEVFLSDMAAFGFPEPELNPQRQVSLHIGPTRVFLDPDAAGQVVSLSRILPELDRKLMVILDRLQEGGERIYPKLRALYRTMPGKSSLGWKLAKRPLLASLAPDPLGGLPPNGEGEIARWALRLPAYLSLGLQGYAAGRRALTAGYSLRTPHLAGIDFKKLLIETEHLYLIDGGDFIELEGNAGVEVRFHRGSTGVMRVDGTEFSFERAAMGKDVAVRAFSEHPRFQSGLQGLMLLSHSFSWTPPKGFDASGPMHGVIVADTRRAPVNDNLVIYSISPDAAGGFSVTIGATVERLETLSGHFRDRRRGYIMARIVSHFLTTMGGEGDGAPIPPPPMHPPISAGGAGRFWYFDEDLHPGNSLEDLVRSARWHAMHFGIN